MFRYRILAFLSVMGPGFITANVDNDPGGILTYSQAGAKFGYALLWTLIPTTIALVVVQEMAARMGAVTGKGVSDLIREEVGFRANGFFDAHSRIGGPRQLRSRVRQYRIRNGNLRCDQVSDRAIRSICRVTRHCLRLLQAGRTSLAGALAALFHLSSVGMAGTSRLARRCAADRRATNTALVRILGDDCGADWNHHHAVDAVLFASIG